MNLPYGATTLSPNPQHNFAMISRILYYFGAYKRRVCEGPPQSVLGSGYSGELGSSRFLRPGEGGPESTFWSR